MLKIHRPFSKHKLFLISITSICIASGLLGISALTYTPELSHAETVAYRSLDDITYMQDMTAEICKHSQENETKQLIDSRDGKTYWVTKLKDNNCWMTQNLDLDIPAKGLSRNDTDIPVDWNSSSAYKPIATKTGSPSGFSGNNVIASYDPGEYVYTTPMKQTNCGSVTTLEGCKNWIEVAGLSTSSSDDERAHYLAGNYYSWAAATAGQAATLTSDTAGEQSTQSICPKSWTLPTGGAGGRQYNTLVKDLTVAQLTTNPYYFVYGGYILNSFLEDAGSNGKYWSSTANKATHAYNLGFDSPNIYPSNGTNRRFGMSVRCVARTEPQETRTLANIEYMQDVTAEICANTPEATADGKFQYQLKDRRDGKTYWTAKLKDNNCWMTQNLDLDLYVDGAARKLTSADSDVTSDWISTTGASGPWATSSSDWNVVKYYDSGEYAYTNPTNHLSSGCGTLDSTACADAGWKLMSGASTDDSRNETTHYLAGNYYSWGAATAGQAASISAAGESTQSVCPKGWRLPYGKDDAADKSFGKLLTSYGTNSDLLYGTQDIRLTPLYFVYGGLVDSSSLRSASSYGNYWSSIANDASFAYYLSFNISVDPSHYNGRFYGYSIRCVAPGGEKKNYDNVEITVNPQLSIEIPPEVAITKSDTNPSTANLDAKVVSNMPYTIQINANKDNADLTSSTSDAPIPAKSGLLNTAENGWGIKLKDDSEFTAVTKDLQTFYTASGAEIKTTTFMIGISTAPDLPSGEYSTNITVTATQN